MLPLQAMLWGHKNYTIDIAVANERFCFVGL